MAEHDIQVELGPVEGNKQVEGRQRVEGSDKQAEEQLLVVAAVEDSNMTFTGGINESMEDSVLIR